MTESAAESPPQEGSPLEVLGAFFALGLRSFGGPVAHIGYFHEAFVDRRRWVDEATFGHLVALSQLLPGPASSQVGMGLGALRAGFAGAVAAWIGFTAPSALLMILFGLGVGRIDLLGSSGLLHGLELAALAVVAFAVRQMARRHCRERRQIALALSAMTLVLALPGVAGQLSAIALGALVGAAFFTPGAGTREAEMAVQGGRLPALLRLLLFAGLLLSLPLPLLARALGLPLAVLVDAFYRAGSLIFGGGHVVLPLLRGEVVAPGWVAPDLFVAGYGAAQALPGPLLSFAAYLGMVAEPGGGVPSALAVLLAIFLPSLLLVTGALPFLARLRRHARIGAALSGVNAAVVGLLLAALYNPVWTSAVTGPVGFAVAAIAFALIAVWRLPAWAVVALCALAGLLLEL